MSIEIERHQVEEEVFLRVLGEAVAILEETAIPYGAMGGIASAAFGRQRWTQDVDFFVRPQDARRAQDALVEGGFEASPTHHEWLLKAVKEGVLVDLIHSAKGGYYLDEEMLQRIRPAQFKGLTLNVVPPEDIVVMKAIQSDQDTARYWHDALGVVAGSELDWDYVLKRARIGPRRVLSLLIHAQADDMLVPDHVIRALFKIVYELAPAAQAASDDVVVAQLRQALAEDPRCNELNIEVTREADRLVLSGQVATAERRVIIATVACEVVPDLTIENRVTVAHPAEDGRSETVA